MSDNEDAGAFSESSRRVLEASIGVAATAGVAIASSVAQSMPRQVQISMAANAGFSALGFWATTSIIHGIGESFIKAGLRGIDLNKRTTKRDEHGALVRPIEGIPIPESQGTICAAVYLLVMSVFIPFEFAGYDLKSFPHAQLTEYLAALLTISLAMSMGFADDVLDLRWRHKIPLPFLATMPLVLVYHANGKDTGLAFLGLHMDLGYLFYFFLVCLAVVSTHAINIYAGVNGLEVGQSVVIAASVLILNVTQLSRIPVQFEEYREQHVQSFFLILPFLACSLALLRLNWFPAKVFVGDTYCYFAGMMFAVVSIVGHFSKTMVIFLIPQIFNAVYSAPQLFKLIPCPRHRMPAFDGDRGYVKNSYAEFVPADLKPLGQKVFAVLRRFRLVHVEDVPDGKGAVRMSNLTLINLVLFKMGACREDVLCVRLVGLQAFCSGLFFILRFGLASHVTL